MPEILVDGIKMTLEGLLVLREITLKVKDGEFVGILGPSGCGKSTLFNIIAGLLRPDEGRILIDGQDVTGETGHVSYMRQNDLLLPSRNILDNVCIPLILKGMSKKDARAEALKHMAEFGLDGFQKYYPSQLSGGMRQRAAMLRTYLFSSNILLLDEPFASLDAITRKKMHMWLIDVFSRLRPTVLFITHDVEEALFLCDRIYVLSECPTSVKVEVEVPFCRPAHGSHVRDSKYFEIRDAIVDALAI